MRLKWTLFTTIFFSLTFSCLIGQSPIYDVKLKLDTTVKTLVVSAEITLPKELKLPKDTIWFHLPFNAYSRYSPFAKEQLKFDKSSFHFRRSTEYCSTKNFNIKHRNIDVSFFYKNEDQEFVGVLAENFDSLTFDYTLNLPKAIDGLGYYKGNYWFRNFYPQLLKYDSQWYFQPYTHYIQPSFRVANLNITISDPGAEIMTNGAVEYVGSDAKIKAINVKDFALQLIANSHKIFRGTFTSGDKIIPYNVVHLIKTNDKDWKDIDSAIQNAAKIWTDILGEYPYHSLNISIQRSCERCFLASGVLQTKNNNDDDFSLDTYMLSILSNVWVEGIFDSSDKRNYWLKDGLSEYYYPRAEKLFVPDSLKFDLEDFGFSGKEHLYKASKKRELFPLNTPINSLNSQQQYINTYGYSAAFFLYLEYIVGQDIFDNTLMNFTNNSEKFTLEKFVSQLENNSGIKLQSVINTYLSSNQSSDYALQGIEWEDNRLKVKINNKDSSSLPFVLSFVKKDESIEDFLISGFKGVKSVLVDIKDLENVNYISIDRVGVLPERNRDNNYYFPNHNMKYGSFKLRNVFTREDPKFKKLLMMLFPAYNSNDKFMLGSVFSNSNDGIRKSLSFAIAPIFSFKSKNPLGQAWMNYDKFLGNKTFDLMTVRVGIKSFNMDYNKKFDYYLRYVKFDPSIKLRFRHLPVTNITSSLTIKANFITEDFPDLDSTGLKGINSINSKIFTLDYVIKKRDVLSTSSLLLSAEQQSYGKDNYLKLTGTAYQRWMYRPKRNFYFRFFASGFLMNTQRQSGSFQNIFTRGSIALIHQGVNDYTYSEYFFSRQNQNLLFDDQVSLASGGGFKTPIGSANNFGISNNMAVSINSSVDLPFSQPWFPLRAYFDLGTYSTYSNDKFINNWMYNGGFSLNFYDIVAIHCPIVFSKDLGNIYNNVHKTFFSRLSFTINLHKLNIWEVEDPGLD